MDLSSQLRTAILAAHLPTPSPTFLTSLLTNRTPPPPLPSLLATARSRLLSADLTTSAIIDQSSPLAVLPPSIDSPQALANPSGETSLPRDVHVQVLDVENLTISRWEQVEELEAIERGERTKGREIIRVSAEDEDPSGDQTQSSGGRQTQTSGNSNAAAVAAAGGGKNATHRLILQDCKGKKIFAVELRRVHGIGVGRTHIGEKMLLRGGTVVARGTALLTPENCVLLGGKVDAWHKTWTEGRLARLKEVVGNDRP